MFAPKRTGGLLLAAIIAVTNSGCSSLKPTVGPMPATDALAAAKAAAQEAGAETELPLEWSADSMFVLRRPASGAFLAPRVKIANLSFSEVGVLDAVRLLASQANLTVRVDGGIQGSERYGAFTVENLSGNFLEVLEEMAEASGFFWEIRNRTLIIRQDDQFMVNLPPVLSEDTMGGVTNTLQYLGAREVYLDRAGRTLTFSANRKGMQQIQRYLENVRETRSLLVYDTHVFQVELNDGLNTGIQWNKFGHASNTLGLAGGAGQVTGQGLLDRVGDSLKTTILENTANGVNFSFAGPKFSMTALLNFLNTQGTLKSLSSPQITMLSGSQGSLRVGKTVQFVSKVGSNSTTGVSQVTTETSSLRVGLSLMLRGDLYDKTVFTQVALSISDITSMDKYTAVGTDLTLPQSADRDLEVSVRSRPGDVVILGGIHVDSESKSASRGLMGFSNDKSRSSSELILVLKTRVIRFVSGKQPSALFPARAVSEGETIAKEPASPVPPVAPPALPAAVPAVVALPAEAAAPDQVSRASAAELVTLELPKPQRISNPSPATARK